MQHNIFLGRIIDNVDPYFAASDCLVLPGIGGLALNQAMFWGKPCIVSEADGTENDLVIDNITGFRFNVNDLESLKKAMAKMIVTPSGNLDEMAKRSIKIIKEKSNVNNMVEVFIRNIKKKI